jgi:chemotaxis protein CheZ
VEPVKASVPAADTQPETAQGQAVLEAIEDLRDFFRDYAELMEESWMPNSITDEKRTLILFHRGLFQQSPSPSEKLDQVSDLYRRLLDVINKEELSFRIPTRSALIPESDNPELIAISRRLRELNAPIERLVAQVDQLKAPTMGDLEERSSALLSTMGALFKGVARQDWDDVILLLKHINLVTTTSKNQGLLQHMAQIARDIYNSLNEFSSEYGVEELSLSAQEIPDAVDRLRSVINRLEEYANANLDALEQFNREMADDRKWLSEALQTVADCQQDLKTVAGADPALAEELRGINAQLDRDVSARLAALQERVKENEAAILSLIANMSFQDLTGQTLKKVIEFIENLQTQLVAMIARYRSAAQPEAKPTQALPLEGPDPKGRPALSQESVDKMLAELGF